jgi:hypothetical protein
MAHPETPYAPVFIVGTGRCGSTMLSNAVRGHSEILSLSELFTLITDLGGRISESFPEGEISAERFFQIIAGAHPKQSLMHRHGVAMDEVLYRPGPGRRFSAAEGVPAILQTTLPHLSPEPEALFDELRRFVLARPAAPAAAHYGALFSWLAERFGKRVWVERSGGSLRIARRLAQAFPNARFVHLVRDGRNCAISMSRHFGFRMAFLSMLLTEILGVDPFASTDRTWLEDIPEELLPFLPERFDGEAFRAYQTPLPLCGHYWSGEIMAGLRELSALPPGRVLTLRYEDFFASPEEALTRLASFIHPDLLNEAWARKFAAAVRPARSAYRDLPEREQSALEAACHPGFAALEGLYPEPLERTT